MDQSLLNDIELDVRELKYWINAASQENKAELQAVVKQHIMRMQVNLDRLARSLEVCPAENNWRYSLSVNDSFRYLREIFDGDACRMKQVLDKADRLDSWEEVLDFLRTQVILDEKEEVTEDFLNFLKNRFN